jgi:hypothetical protein
MAPSQLGGSLALLVRYLAPEPVVTPEGAGYDVLLSLLHYSLEQFVKADLGEEKSQEVAYALLVLSVGH